MWAAPPLAAALVETLWLGGRLLVIAFGLLLVTGTLLSLTRLTGWFARMWDFPRLQIAALAVAGGILEPLLASASAGAGWLDWSFLALMLAVALWQASRIYSYTPLARREVRASAARRGDPNVLRIVISNVLQDNRQFDRWRGVVAAEDAEVIVAAEVDRDWAREIAAAFGETHPYSLVQPQDNCYGMALFSRLPLRDPRVEFIVQSDIPSIHATLRLRDGTEICLHCLHPRPPTPQEQQSSGPRDVELIVVGKRVRKQRETGRTEPTIIVGDLNDVAWSRTTRLFQKLSGLLDPRRGRGFYNTFNANSRLMRFPLDHVFISREFRLVDLRVLEHVGSDHFPVSITISFEPQKQGDQKENQPGPQDEREAQQRLEDQKRS
jgi:endonuclease/exonuclease/phosphatase (EEP) superfamily protein YafD